MPRELTERLAALRTRCHADGVLRVVTRLEEIVGVVRRGLAELLAPAFEIARLTAVGVLELMGDERIRKGRVVGVGDVRRVVRTAFFGSDEDHAVGAAVAVERCGRSTRQHRQRLDVVGIDARNAVAVADARTFVIVVRLGRAERHHRNAVEYVEHVVVAEERFGAAHYHAGRTAGTRRRLVDAHAGHLADQTVHHAYVLDDADVVARNLLYVVCQ